MKNIKIATWSAISIFILAALVALKLGFFEEKSAKSVSAIGDVLITGVDFWNGNRQVHNIQKLDLTTNNLTSLTVSTPPFEHDSTSARFAANGTKVVFDSVRDRDSNGDTLELYVMDYPSGNNQTRLTTNFAVDDETPDWCVGDNKIVFARWNEIGSAIMKMDMSGNSLVQLTDGTFEDTEPRCGGNGVEISFSRRLPNNNRAIFKLNGSSNIIQLTPSGYDCINPSWSEAGDWLAASCRNQSNNLSNSIYRMRPYLDAQGMMAADFEKVTTPPTGLFDDSPIWSPDGASLVFNRSNGTVQNFETQVLDIALGTTSTFQGTQVTMVVSDWK
jgi:Tol biopolymer transport system component